MNIKSKMSEKVNSNKGMTLTEVLCAVLLVALVSLSLATGVTLAQKTFKKSMRLSEAQELYATLESLISNELRYTGEVSLKNGNEVDTFFSVTYALQNSSTRLYALDDNGNVTKGYGQLAIGDEDTGEYNRLLAKASYTNDLGAKVSITYDKDTSMFTVNLDVGTTSGSIVNKSFNVRAINEIVLEGSGS